MWRLQKYIQTGINNIILFIYMIRFFSIKSTKIMTLLRHQLCTNELTVLSGSITFHLTITEIVAFPHDSYTQRPMVTEWKESVWNICTFIPKEKNVKDLKIGISERFSNDAVRANELPRHLHVAAGLVDEGQVEGDLSLQVHLVIWHSLRVRPWRQRHGHTNLFITDGFEYSVAWWCHDHLFSFIC